MKQSEGQRDDRRERRSTGRKRALMYRRIGAVVLVVMACALGYYLCTIKLTGATLMWGAGCALLIVEALMLWVDLPVSRLLQGVIGVVCVALLAGGYINHNYANVDGRLVPRYALLTRLKVEDHYPAHFRQMESLQTLDMRGSTITDFEPIQSLASLEHLDLRENYAFNQEEHDVLQGALPGCDIRWSVPVSRTHFDSKAKSVDVSRLNLTTAQLRELFADYPDTEFQYMVPLCGQRYATDTTELNLRGQAVDVGVIDDALGLLPAVEQVDLRGEKASSQTVSMLCDAHPDVRFMFTCDVPGAEMTTEDTDVKVDGTYEDLLAYLAFMDYMPNLKSMDASAIELSDEQVDTISEVAKNGKLKYSVMVFGMKVDSLATELNLDNVPISSVEDVERCLARLPKLTRVSMCDTGLTEDQMGELFDAHPDIKFVWWIEFGHYRLRTDATAFTTALGTGNRYGYDDETFKAIRYCTDLMMLDLGHNHITSIDNFTGLKKLRVLILADNKLTDISQITAFPDLEYLELFLNDITDVSPVLNLTRLMDFNIFHNPLYENHKVLRDMTWLKRLWIGGCRLSQQDVKDLQAALPNTQISTIGQSSTGRGWRKHTHYDTIKQMYEEGRYIPFVDSMA